MAPGSMTSIAPYAVGADSISAREPCWLRQVCGRALSAPTCNSPSTCSIIICPIVSTFASEVTPMPGDLHTHTTFSDGSTPADKLPFLAACAGMTHLAISDHDSIRSVRYAYAHPVQNGVHLIPATELTAYDYERAHRVHLLCYWQGAGSHLPPVPHRGGARACERQRHAVQGAGHAGAVAVRSGRRHV